MKRLIVGLTGGIGSGKSAAADRFSDLGAAIIDSDAIAHELTRPGGAAIPLIETAFGRDVIAVDGSLDRAAMRRLVFADAVRRSQLEGILHPMIHAVCIARRDAALAGGAPYAIMVVPLLVESGLLSRFDRIAVVDCPEELQIARVMARNGLAADDVKAIMAAQATREERLAVADDVILNEDSLEALQAQVAALHAKYCAFAGNIRTRG